LSWCASRVSRFRTLRHDFHTRSSAWSTTSSVRVLPRPSFFSRPATAAVFGSLSANGSITVTAFSLARRDSADASAARRCFFGISVR